MVKKFHIPHNFTNKLFVSNWAFNVQLKNTLFFIQDEKWIEIAIYIESQILGLKTEHS